MNEESIQPTQSPQPAEQPEKKDRFFYDIFKFTIIILVIILPIRFFVAQPYLVNGASMDPTFETNQYIIVNQLSYHFNNPARGEVIIFRYPKDPSVYFIKRVIGLPGEKVIINGSTVTIVNKAHPLGFTLNEPYISARNQSEDSLSIELGPDQYFVMGDNRRQSSDSRVWGPVPRNLIVGTPFIRLFPLNKVGIEPGFYKELQ